MPVVDSSFEFIAMSVVGQDDSQQDWSIGSERTTVSFSTLEIREYAVVLGSNPSTTHGPPLEIDWNAQSCEVFDLDYYESLRGRRREKRELAMPSFVRENL